MSGEKRINASGIGLAIEASVIKRAEVLDSATLADPNILQLIKRKLEERKNKLEQREKELQAKIDRVKALASRSHGQSVDQPIKVSSASINKSNNQPKKEATNYQSFQQQKELESYKAQLPEIKTEYQNLVKQGLLDHESTNSALEAIAQAINNNDLQTIKSRLSALDDARIQAYRQRETPLQGQKQLLQQHLDEFKPFIPPQEVAYLQTQIEQYQPQDFDTLSQALIDYQIQGEAVWEAAENLVKSWQKQGYHAQIIGFDGNDLIIEAQTHDNANTVMRIPFSGERIELFGPPEEDSSCTLHTGEMLRDFASQGYVLEWDQWDGEKVPEDLRYFYLQEENAAIVTNESESREQVSYYSQQPKSNRSAQSQGY